MKPDAVVINIGRGPVIDEAAMVRALAAKRIKGAALDVFDTEPLPAGHPFYTLENVLLSPHCADHTPDWMEQAMRFFLEQFERFRNGEPLPERGGKTPRLLRFEQHFERPARPGALEGPRGFPQGKAARDQLLHGNQAVLEQRQGGLEAAAARAHQRDLVDDDGGGIHRHRAVHGGFQNQGAARPGHGGGGAQSFGAAGGVHHPVVGGRGQRAAADFRGHARLRGDPQFLGVPAELMHPVAVGAAAPCAISSPSLPSPSTATVSPARNRHLVQDLAGRGQRLGEYGALRRDRRPAGRAGCAPAG